MCVAVMCVTAFVSSIRRLRVSHRWWISVCHAPDTHTCASASASHEATRAVNTAIECVTEVRIAVEQGNKYRLLVVQVSAHRRGEERVGSNLRVIHRRSHVC